MTAITFIHTSDFQLGMTRWFLKGEAQGRFNDDREAAIVRLGELAEETGAEFIVVAGDVFEHNALSRDILARATEMFKRLPVPVYVLPGNHDPLVADSVFIRPARRMSTSSQTQSPSRSHPAWSWSVRRICPSVRITTWSAKRSKRWSRPWAFASPSGTVRWIPAPARMMPIPSTLPSSRTAWTAG